MDCLSLSMTIHSRPRLSRLSRIVPFSGAVRLCPDLSGAVFCPAVSAAVRPCLGLSAVSVAVRPCLGLSAVSVAVRLCLGLSGCPAFRCRPAADGGPTCTPPRHAGRHRHRLSTRHPLPDPIVPRRRPRPPTYLHPIPLYCATRPRLGRQFM